MKKKLLLLLTFVFVFTLSGCFGNYREGYVKYSQTVGTYPLYYQNLEEGAACPKEEGFLYTLYSIEGNTFQYTGMRSGDGCRVELFADTGSGFTSIANLLSNEKITVEDLEAVIWTFELIIEQTPDHTIGTVNFIEYFQEIGDYEVFVIDHGETICHDMNTVMLFEHRGVEYDVVGAPSGNGCVSEYFIYYIEEAEETDDDATDDDVDDTTEPEGELMTINSALQFGYVTVAEISAATYESDIFEIYIEGQVMAIEVSIYFVRALDGYTELNPYVLSNDERNTVLGILATNRYRYALEEDTEELHTICVDIDDNAHKYQIFEVPVELTEDNHYPEETVIAVLTITDMFDSEYVYEIYDSGIRLQNEDVNVYTEHLNQTYILDLLEEMKEIDE